MKQFMYVSLFVTEACEGYGATFKKDTPFIKCLKYFGIIPTAKIINDLINKQAAKVGDLLIEVYSTDLV